MAQKKTLDPEQFGLSRRTILVDLGRGKLAIVKDRKSRIIVKDGKEILAQAEKIRQSSNYTSLVLQTGAPVCSKTTALLEQAGIKIEPL